MRRDSDTLVDALGAVSDDGYEVDDREGPVPGSSMTGRDLAFDLAMEEVAESESRFERSPSGGTHWTELLGRDEVDEPAERDADAAGSDATFDVEMLDAEVRGAHADVLFGQAVEEASDSVVGQADTAFDAAMADASTEMVGSDEAFDAAMVEASEEVAGADLDEDVVAALGSVVFDADNVVGDESHDGALTEEEKAAVHLFGELMGRSRAFRSYAEKVLATSRPLLASRRTPALRARDWQLDFGPISAPAGRVTTLTINPQCLFRGEKVVATDTANPAGTGTRIVSVVVGQKVQRPVGRSSLTQFFSTASLASGILFDTAQQWCQVAVTVSFVSACTFDMSVFGKAIVD